MSKEETVEIAVKVPKRLIEFLEEQGYFNWEKQDFFEAAIRSQISNEMCLLDFDEMHKLENDMLRKYGEHLGVVDISLKKSVG